MASASKNPVMADRADVVPLPLGRRGRGGPEFPPPADFFVDAVDPARALSLTWSPDHTVVQLAISAADGTPAALVLRPDEVLSLVRALVEGLPETSAACPRPPGVVLPFPPAP